MSTISTISILKLRKYYSTLESAPHDVRHDARFTRRGSARTLTVATDAPQAGDEHTFDTRWAIASTQGKQATE